MASQVRRRRRRTITVTFKRGDIWLLTTERYELADGVTIRLLENYGKGGKPGFSTGGEFLIERLEGVPIDIVVALVSAWLYDRLKRNKATLRMDRSQVDVDDKGKVRRFIRDHILRKNRAALRRKDPAKKAARPKARRTTSRGRMRRS